MKKTSEQAHSDELISSIDGVNPSSPRIWRRSRYSSRSATRCRARRHSRPSTGRRWWSTLETATLSADLYGRVGV